MIILKTPEAEFYLPVQQQKAQLGAEAFRAAVEVILSISIFFLSMMHAESDLCVLIFGMWLYQDRVKHQCVLSLLALTFFGLVSIIDGVSLTSWNSGYFFCYVILILKPCKQRTNTFGTRVNTLVCI